MNTNTQISAPVDQLADALKLLLIDDLQSNDLQDKLLGLSSAVVESTQGLDSLAAKVSGFQPDVLILSVQSLSPATLNELGQLHETNPLPVIVVAKEYARSVVETVVSAGVSAYLVDEVSAERLRVIIDMSIVRFKQEQELISELQETKEKLSDRKLIERAKGIVMKQKHLSEEDAYAQMRKTAMNKGQSMAALAKRIISVFEMLDG